MIGGVFSASVPQRGMQTVRSGVCYYSRTQRKSNVVITDADDVWLLCAISYDRAQVDPEPS